jgi:two-component system, OmpR family, KDP operon response regulator KdpE
MDTMVKILVVDDDPAICDALAEELEAAGYAALTAVNGEDGLRSFRAGRPDLIVTDLAMPVADGFRLIESIRRVDATPIIVISVRGGDSDKIRALDLGADDYVVKPFSMPELLARVRAQLRRTARREVEILRFAGLTIDRTRRQVTLNGSAVHLTPTEFSILDLLATNAGIPVTLDTIISRVWKAAPGTTNDTVRVHVGTLRRKVEPDPSNPRYIVTEPWIGYRFIEEPL